MDFRPLDPDQRQKLIDALRGNAQSSAAILTNPRDTSFAGTTDEVTDDPSYTNAAIALGSLPTPSR